MALCPAPSSWASTLGCSSSSSKRQEAAAAETTTSSLINLPPSLSQTTPIYRTTFYVDEASLYSIAEDSREDRQSEITSRAGTMSSASTAVSGRIDPSYGLRSSSGCGSSWGIDSGDGDDDDDEDWEFGRPRHTLGPTIIKGARSWNFDAEQSSNSPSDDTYPLAGPDPPVALRRHRGKTLWYASLLCLLLASIAVISCTPIFRKMNASQLVAAGVVSDDRLATPSESPILSQSPSHSQYLSSSQSPSWTATVPPASAVPTLFPTFPLMVNSADEKAVYSVIASCDATDLTDLLDEQTVQYQIYNQLVVEKRSDPKLNSDDEVLERWALIMLYVSLSGEFWNDGSSWFVPGLPVCSWGDGTISCDTRFNGRATVTGLHLKSNGLSGAIPKELCCLKRLEILDLSSNSLLGTVPACIKNMTLDYLDLSGNPKLVLE